MPVLQKIIAATPSGKFRGSKGSATKMKYGTAWPFLLPDISIELSAIRLGGRWSIRGEPCGEGLAYHHQQAVNLLWPELDNHRWHELCLKSMTENTATVLLGPKSSGKTHEAAKFALTEYFSAPDQTTILISSITIQGLELRIWGEIKKLWQMAKNRYDFLPGHLIDSKHCFSTDNIDEDEVRDLRNGIIGLACKVNHRFVGLGSYVGIKNKRVRLIADEAQFMTSSFLDSISNLDANPDFKVVILGNPLDPLDSLGKAAEPKGGWSSVGEPTKTTIWETNFKIKNKPGIAVNLVGTDSPNFDYPADQSPKYPYLICQSSIDSTIAFYSKQSQQYYTQCVGVMKTGLVSRRVINREMCRQFNCFDSVIWATTKRTKIYALDAAYGNIGGDRCIGGKIEWGKDVEGRTVVEVGNPVIVPVQYQLNGVPAEDQIAEFVKEDCEKDGIPPENVFFDATGRGSLGTSFARIWSSQVNPVEFGGNPTTRPVCQDIFIIDQKTKIKRLKLCTEEYSKFVTELWFSVRYTVESNQLRNLPQEVMEEGCQREWKIVKGNKIEIETKTEMKERTGRSPDLFDWLATAIEGARRKGFLISKLANEQIRKNDEWMRDLQRKSRALSASHKLNYAA